MAGTEQDEYFRNEIQSKSASWLNITSDRCRPLAVIGPGTNGRSYRLNCHSLEETSLLFLRMSKISPVQNSSRIAFPPPFQTVNPSNGNVICEVASGDKVSSFDFNFAARLFAMNDVPYGTRFPRRHP